MSTSAPAHPPRADWTLRSARLEDADDIAALLDHLKIKQADLIGHSMGAASALASVACSLAITEGFVPPTINHVENDPECDVDCVPNVRVDREVNVVQNNGLAFGGNNSVLLLAKYREAS